MKSKNVIFIAIVLLGVLFVSKYYTYKISSQNIILSHTPLIIQEVEKINDENLLDTNIEVIEKDNRTIYDPVKKIYISVYEFNNYSRKELINFKGIGEKTADKILEYRLSKGDFDSFDELLHIKGIGVKKLNSLLDTKE